MEVTMLKYFYFVIIIIGLTPNLPGNVNSDDRIFKVSPNLKFRVYQFTQDFSASNIKQLRGKLIIPKIPNVSVAIDGLNKKNINDYISEINKINIADSVFWGIPDDAIKLLPKLGKKCLGVKKLTLQLLVENKEIPDISYFKELSHLRILIGFKTDRKIIKKGKLISYSVSKEEQNYLGKLITYVGSLKNVRNLSIRARYMNVDLTSLNNQKNINSLTITAGKLTLPENLGIMENLTFSCLVMSDFPKAMAAFKKLSSLKFDIANSSSAVSLPEMPDLELLDLSWNNFCIIKLNNMQELKKLRLTNCLRLTAISGLNNISRLQVLELQAQNFKDSAALKALHNLKSLNLGCCKNINSLEFLTKLRLLQDLNLYGCSGINDFSPITKLADLKKLNIVGCEIQNYDFLRSLSNLEELRISSHLTKESFKNKVNSKCKIIQVPFMDMPFPFTD
jgi:hypothetical protein